jgi:hypothetical protein
MCKFGAFELRINYRRKALINLLKVNVLIYKITGRQLFFTIPSSVCEECDLTVSLANKVANEIKDDKITIEVKPWLRNIVSAISKKALHPPVLLINGHVFSQGTVPDEKKLRNALLDELGK